MIVDGDDPQAAISAPRFTIDPGHRARSRSRTISTRRGSTRSRPAATTIDVVQGYRHGPGIAHAIECLDGRATVPAPIRAPKAAPPGCSPYPGRVPASSSRVLTIPNLISLVRLLLRAGVPLAALEGPAGAGRRGGAARRARRDRLGRRLHRPALRPGQRARQDPRSRRPTACCSRGAVALLFQDLGTGVDVVLWIMIIREVLDRGRHGRPRHRRRPPHRRRVGGQGGHAGVDVRAADVPRRRRGAVWAAVLQPLSAGASRSAASSSGTSPRCSTSPRRVKRCAKDAPPHAESSEVHA